MSYRTYRTFKPNSAVAKLLDNTGPEIPSQALECVWLSKKEAAQYLRVSKSTIDNLESLGLLIGYRIYIRDKKPILRFRKEDLDELLFRRPKGRPRKVNNLNEAVDFLDKSL